MVIWVFAGGGETEAGGLIKFLQKIFPHYVFRRYTPFDSTKKGAKPNKKSTFGISNTSLIQSIQKYLPLACLKEKHKPDLILVIDDLDCGNLNHQHQQFLDCIANIPKVENIDRYIAFAAPEIEAWIIADWDHTLAKAEKFKARHERMRHWLSTEKKVPFDQPESFGEYDPDKKACKEKLSNLLIEASSQKIEDQGKQYKKSEDSPDLLLLIEKTILCQKCPIFRDFYYYLENLKPLDNQDGRL
ncbi:MAG: DUF4276 family protein [Snowella sp.]|nr:DUF4276 family protein [Snowella sp.]